MTDPYVPDCPDCGADCEWIECENCDGTGERDGVDCLPCREEGGEWSCLGCEVSPRIRRES